MGVSRTQGVTDGHVHVIDSRKCRWLLLAIVCFSFFLNVLALTGPLYMLQVYDRVLPSRSGATLMLFSVLAFGLLTAYGLLEFFRGRLACRLGHVLTVDCERDSLAGMVFGRPSRLQDLAHVRRFMAGAGLVALLDAPCVPIYVLALFVLHPILGWVGLLAVLLLLLVMWLLEATNRKPSTIASLASRSRAAMVDALRQHPDGVRCLVAGGIAERRWYGLADQYLAAELQSQDATHAVRALGKTLRLMMHAAVLGVGASLVIADQASAGVMMAGSLLLARSVAPIDPLISHWGSFLLARKAWTRLQDERAPAALRLERDDLCSPARSFSVQVSEAAGADRGLRHRGELAFSLQAGAGLGVIGPCAAGKTTLLEAMIGVRGGELGACGARLDGLGLAHWGPRLLARHIGFLPQNVTLLPGTIAENIARFSPSDGLKSVIAAANAAGIHDMIMQLDAGYDTFVGEGGVALSAGQRQRVGLARALFGDPFLLVLDEPGTHLDGFGEAAVINAVRAARARGGIVVVATHRISMLASVDTVLALGYGRAAVLGNKDIVLNKIGALPTRSEDGYSAGSGVHQSGFRLATVTPLGAN